MSRPDRVPQDEGNSRKLGLAVQAEAAQLRPVIEWIPRYDHIIAQQFALHPEHELFESFPGAGPVYAPRLLIALGTDRSRWASSADLQSHSGIAPVTEQSGISCSLHRRMACSDLIRQAFHEFSAQYIQWSCWATADY